MKETTKGLMVIVSILFVAMLTTNVMASETTLSGKIMAEGTFMTDDGQAFMISGDKVQELNENIGKQIELKGTVQEQEGKSTIAVSEYKILGTSAPKIEEPVSKAAEPKPGEAK